MVFCGVQFNNELKMDHNCSRQLGKILMSSCLYYLEKDLIDDFDDINVHDFRMNITIWEMCMCKFKVGCKASFRNKKKRMKIIILIKMKLVV